MKRLYLFALTALFLTSGLSAQVHKFRSSQSVLYENMIPGGKIYGEVNFTFDYDKKLITIESCDNNGTRQTSFNMNSTVPEKGTIMGDGNKIYVSSTDKPEVISISINKDISAIWLELKNSTIFYVDLTKIQ